MAEIGKEMVGRAGSVRLFGPFLLVLRAYLGIQTRFGRTEREASATAAEGYKPPPSGRPLKRLQQVPRFRFPWRYVIGNHYKAVTSLKKKALGRPISFSDLPLLP